MRHVPLLDNVLAMAEAGCVTGASARNWGSYAAEVRLAPQFEGAHQALLCDPQTSGGLLVTCAPEAASGALKILERHGCARARVIGTMTAGAPAVRVEP
jgi:selenide,water dikinase